MDEKEVNKQNERQEEEKEGEIKPAYSALDKDELVKLVTELVTENEKLISEKGKVEEYKDNWLRSRADFENFKKRNNETRRIAYEDGKSDVIKQILSIGDNLERALISALDEKTRQGVEMLSNNFKEVMKNLGVEEINPQGEFDPTVAEAVMSVDAQEGEQSGHVKQVFLKGYKLGGKIIRFAQVVVIK